MYIYIYRENKSKISCIIIAYILFENYHWVHQSIIKTGHIVFQHIFVRCPLLDGSEIKQVVMTGQTYLSPLTYPPEKQRFNKTKY